MKLEFKLEFTRQIFEKCSNAKFNENPSSRSRVVLCGRTDRQTDMMKLIVALRDSANAHNTNLSVVSTSTNKSNNTGTWEFSEIHKTTF
jgi:site-specific DNA-cytosine methylase